MSTYIVKKGDTLWDLAKKFNTTVSELARINNIKNPDYIVVGQKLETSGTASKPKSSNNMAVVTVFGIQSNTERTMYTTWEWKQSNTKEYQVMWYYDTGDGVWFIGNDSTTTYQQSIYTPPNNAKKVKFKVKPISKTYVADKKEVNYWTAQWSTEQTHTLAEVLDIPPVPTVKIEKYKLTATLENLDVMGKDFLNIDQYKIEFYVCKDNKTQFATSTVKIVDKFASYSCNIIAGSVYKVRCRTVKGNLRSEWSDYSANYDTSPRAPEEITSIKALSTTEVQLYWEQVPNSETYDIEYTTEKRYFDSSDQTSTKTVDATVAGHAEITGLETGHTYFFRVRACNSAGKSGWTPIKSITIGKKPTSPTTWSSATTAIVGENVNLYWVHNAEDGSSQTYAQLELNINGNKTVKTIKNSTDEDEKDKTSVYTIDTSSYTEGTVIKWRVKTKGILDEYSDWSTQRTIDVYAPPILVLEVNDVNGNAIETLTHFPFYIQGTAGPNTQKPIGYHVTVYSNNDYETIDQLGNSKIVSTGDAIYSKYFDTDQELVIELSAGNIDLQNNVGYTVDCTVSMNSGLTANAAYVFNVGWTEQVYEPNAAIGYDPDTFTTIINPYCKDENEVLIEDAILSVYRIEYDGSFTEIATEIENNGYTYVTDPHPSLNYARYRIVAISKTTGFVGYFDMPGHYIGEKAIIIQWAEDWREFNVSEDEVLEEKPWTGSLLRLPYNIDTTDNNNPDVSMIEYVGREDPVSYYGTHLRTASTWNVEIPADDEDTIYALRRLARWMDNVYVREPSGTGYWANIKVSFNTRHKAVTIPVTLGITKVEGGM